jgi:RNA polymerase sigma-70 factor (ECF subfamily)
MRSQFVTTSWTQVLAARDAASTESRQALETLCQAYWYPLYALVRRQGFDPEEARDLTQGYFAELLEKGYLDDFDPALGRFRVFLKASVKHFLSKEREKAQTWKRGGRTTKVSLDIEDGEGRYRHEPVDRLTPEEIYERRWALTILERALGRLRTELTDADRGPEFDRLKGFLTGEEPKRPYREVATELSTTEAAIKTSVHRLRQRFGALLRQEIAETVARPDEVDDEVRYLLGVIAPWGPKAS